MRYNFSIYKAFVCAVTIALVIGFPVTSYSQTRFDWNVKGDPVFDVDLESYRLPEACVAAVNRINRAVSSRSPIYIDTIPYSHEEALKVLSPEAQEAASRCINIHEAHVSMSDAVVWLPLYLAAGKYDGARILASRMINEIPKDSVEKYARRLETIARIYMSSQPVDIPLVESLAVQAFNAPEESYDKIRRFLLSLDISRVARRRGEKETEQIWINKSSGFFSELSPTQKTYLMGDRYYRMKVKQLTEGVRLLNLPVLLDSLSIGTAVYQRHLIGLVTASLKIEASLLGPMFPDQRVPELTGEYWFQNRGDSSYSQLSHVPSLPASSKVNLVVFQGQDVCIPAGMQRFCFEEYALVKRIKSRFPDIEIVYVTNTKGFFRFLNPMNPQEEADLIAQDLIGFNNLPITLVVSETPFFRLSGFDKRRINEKTENQIAYSFGQDAANTRDVAYLIDKDGLIVSHVRLTRYDEQNLFEYLTVLTNRPSLSGDR